MALSGDYRRERSFELSLDEFTGAIGDAITAVPIVVALAALTDLSLVHLLLGFAVFQVIWGIYYGLPMSVEPMKALAALVIAGTLTAGELAVAGLLAGGVLVGIGLTGTLSRVERYIGQPVVRGVQVAVALILLETSVQLSLDGITLALVATAIALVVIGMGYWRASGLIILGVGAVITVVQTGLPTLHVPRLILAVPSVSSVSLAAVEGMIAQLAMTVGNAAIATSVLLSDYYDADVSGDELATSMGLMNLFAIPLGAIPMCHGSGGIAGKYAFGARTAGANLILGVGYAVVAVFAVGIIAAFPLSMLGVVLGLIAIELGRTGLNTNHLPLTVGVGFLGVVTNVGIAFVVGVAGYLMLNRLQRV